MYQYGETVITQPKEVARAARRSTLMLAEKTRPPGRLVENTRTQSLPNSIMAVFSGPITEVSFLGPRCT